MGTIKGGRRENAKRILYSVSEQLTTGWLTTQISAEVFWTPNELPEGRQKVHTVDEGNGRWSDRRQTELFIPGWDSPEGHQGEGKAPEGPTASTTTQEEEGQAECVKSHLGSYGSRLTRTSELRAERSYINDSITTSSPQRRWATESNRSYPLPLTNQSSHQPQIASRTSVTAVTASEESSGKSLFPSHRTLQGTTMESSAPQESSFSGLTTPVSPSNPQESSVPQARETPWTPGSGGEVGYSPTAPLQSPRSTLSASKARSRTTKAARRLSTDRTSTKKPQG